MSPKRYNPPRCPKPAFWPEPDRQRWEWSQRRNRDLVESDSLGVEWAPRTRKRVEEGYGRWISWLTEKGHLDPYLQPGSRVTRDRVGEYVTALRAINAPAAVLSRIQELYAALTVIAPDRDWSWIHKFESQLRRMVTRGHRGRTGLPSSKSLFALGLKLMQEAERPSACTAVERAVQYRDGLMISLLASRPLRRHNFAAIEIGRHLVKRGDEYWIRFEAVETKARVPIEVPFPTALVPFLECYLAVYRLLLARCDGYWNRAKATAHPPSALWLSQHGTAMAEVAISSRFKKMTRDRLGRAVTMHRFRDCAATSIAVEDPEHIRITKCILGHTTLRTSERHYNHAQSLQAFRRHQAGILDLRRTLARSTRRNAAPTEEN